MKNKYVDFRVTPYALAHVINALEICEIYDYVVTLADNDLVVRFESKKIDNRVYGTKDIPQTPCAAPTKEDK